MNWALPVLLAASAVQAAPAQVPAPSPLLGRWALDISTLPFPPERLPKSVTTVLEDVGGGKWRMSVDIVGGDGSRSHAEAIAPLDGTPVPMAGSMEADHVSVTTPLPNMMIMALSAEGTPGTTRIFTVAPDGDTETETHVYPGPDGRLTQRTVRWTRIR